MQVIRRRQAGVLAGHRRMAQAERGRQVDVLRKAGTAGDGTDHREQRRIRYGYLRARDIRVERADYGRDERILKEGTHVVCSAVRVRQPAARVVALGQDDGEAVERRVLLDVVADAVESGDGSAGLGAAERQVDADLDDRPLRT